MDGRNGVVVVTGASTGIGSACALDLDRRGYRVFAGVRRAEDGQVLRAESSGRLVPLRLDVTRPGEIADAASAVTQACAGGGLHGLVNNAGVAVAGPLEFLPLDELRAQFEVNVLGLLGVTQAFLPLLRMGRGRIVNLGSVSGRISMPFVGPYAASKHALEAISDSLRVELRPWGIDVVLLEPGVVRTPIWDKGREAGRALRERVPPSCEALYGRALDRLKAEVDRIEGSGLPPRAIARCVARALSCRRPKTRYVVGRAARAQLLLSRLAPDRLRDWIFGKMLGTG